jgi:hypothetical protein
MSAPPKSRCRYPRSCVNSPVLLLQHPVIITLGFAYTEFENMPRKLIKKALLGSGILGLASRFRENSVAVIMYHSVMDDPSTILQQPAVPASPPAVTRLAVYRFRRAAQPGGWLIQSPRRAAFARATVPLKYH